MSSGTRIAGRGLGTFFVWAALFLIGELQSSSAQSPAESRWFKGNLHTHTINSDGDSSPYDVMAWYKRHGYQFVAITDHNTLTDPATVDTNPSDNFLVIGGEEITNARSVHVNAIGITRTIPVQEGSTVTELLQASIDATRAQGGVPLINHPNWQWAFTAKEMLPLQRAALVEIASGHPGVNHNGDGRIPSTEQMWDELLSAGMRIFGVAVDDVHNFREEFAIDLPNPGRAWVTVRATALTRERILAALNDGEFYSSTGVTLSDVLATADSLTVTVQPSSGNRSNQRYRVVFIGKDGRVLMTSDESPARYAFVGSEGYVRARIEDSSGFKAWTQPVVVKSQSSPDLHR